MPKLNKCPFCGETEPHIAHTLNGDPVIGELRERIEKEWKDNLRERWILGLTYCIDPVIKNQYKVAEAHIDLIIDDLNKAITEEINIAISENQPTSRLTSLFNKINKS